MSDHRAMARIQCPLRNVVVYAVMVFLAVAPGLAEGTAADPKEHHLRKAREALEEGREDNGFLWIQLAADASDGATRDQLIRLAELDFRVSHYPRVIETISRLARQTGTDDRPGASETLPPSLARMMGQAMFFVARSLGESAEEKDFQATRFSDAEAMLRFAATAEPPDREAGYWLAEILIAQGRFEEANAVLDLYLKQFSEELIAAAETLAECLEKGWLRGIPRSTERFFSANSEGLLPPKRVEAPPPEYTRAARWAEIQGAVTLETIIDRDGRPTCIQPLEGLPLGLTEAAIEALSHWRFEPARLNGKAVPSHYQLILNFSLTD